MPPLSKGKFIRSANLWLGVFAVAFTIQAFFWQNFDFVDKNMWIDQTEYIDTGDQRAYNARFAYGHPGTVVVGLAIIIHRLSTLSYTTTFLGSLALANAAVIASIAILCSRIRPQHAWWAAAAGLVMFNRLFTFATPPAALVSPFIVLLFLMALHIYESTTTRWSLVIGWGITAGLSAATRADITGAAVTGLLIFMKPKIQWQHIGVMITVALSAFSVANPFMWSHPVQHVADIVLKAHYHYSEFEASHLPLQAFITNAPLALISIGLALVFVFMPKIPQPLPRRFLASMLVITGSLSAIFLTAHYQTLRYFLPLIFLWEIFLPLFIVELIPHLKFDFLKTQTQQNAWRRALQKTIIIGAILIQATMLFHLWSIPEMRCIAIC